MLSTTVVTVVSTPPTEVPQSTLHTVTMS